MDRKYKIAELEENGVEATGVFEGNQRKGWIMNSAEFVSYDGYTQLVVPTASLVDLTVENWTETHTHGRRLHVAIRFNRERQFPRFSMKKGEGWGFSLYKQNLERLKAIEAGEPFEFAGGQCLAQDVNVVYIGLATAEYERAQGIYPGRMVP